MTWENGERTTLKITGTDTHRSNIFYLVVEYRAKGKNDVKLYTDRLTPFHPEGLFHDNATEMYLTAQDVTSTKALKDMAERLLPRLAYAPNDCPYEVEVWTPQQVN